LDVRLSEEQELLRASAREILTRECPMALVRAMIDDSRGLPDELWKKMAELGWMGLPFSRSHDGAGLGFLDLVVLLEEMGRALVPGPFFSSVALAGAAVDLAGDESQKRALLPPLARGERRAALALVEEPERWDADGVRLEARRSAGGLRLGGAKRFVLDAPSADWLVVVTRLEGELALLAIDVRTPGVTQTPTALVDATRKAARVSFDGAAVPADGVLARGAESFAPLLDRAKVALCAEMLGGAQRALELSIAYARTREQFGQPIGSFQAIQHRLADMLVAVEGARSATWYAAWAIERGEPDAHLAACMAKAYVSEAYARIAGDAIQIHGGLGFTWEQDVQLYYKRAKLCERLFGDGTANRELVARAAIDRPG